MLEKHLEKYFKNSVEKAGGLTFKWISTVTGVPDRIAFLNKKVHLVELKAKSGRLSARQLLVFSLLEKQGFRVTVLYSEEEVEAFIKFNT
jgi:hypothetical protein